MKIIKYTYPKLFFLFFLICQLLVTPSLTNASPDNQDSQRVLVVNSYHPGYTWSDDIVLGIQDELGAQRGIEVIIEYLDTKRHFEKSYFRQLKELYRQKYKLTDIDIIITSDDNALDFILSIRKELFPDTPHIFCGIDHINTERIAGHEPLYGIEEADSTASTIDLILSIHPDIESITFIADATSTGKLMLDRTRKLKRTFQKYVHFNFIIGVSVEELQLTLKDIPENAVIFYLSFIRDKNGKVFSIEDSMKIIAENSNVPVYCSWGFQQDTGIMGGNILSGYKQGEISAIVAKKLLANESVESIPAIQQAPLVYKFDHKALDRFNIDESSIPKNSIIYNKPFSFYEEYKTLIVITLFIGLCLVLFIMLLSLNMERRKKAETELQKAHDNLDQKVKIRTAKLMQSNDLLKEEIKERKQAEESLQSREAFFDRIIDQSPFATWISDAEGILQRANPALKKFLNLTDEQLVGKYNVLKDPLVIRQGLLPLVRTVFDEGKSINFTCDWDGNDIPTMDLHGSNSVCVEATMFPIYNPEGELTNVVLNWIDVTDRKQLEKQLQQSQKMEAIGTLSGGIAHDFNNMLSVMIGNTELAMDDVPEWNPARDNLEEVKIAGLRAKDVVQQLLSFSRKSDQKQKPVNISPIIKDAAKFLRSSIPTSIEIRKTIPDEMGIISADPTQIHQVMMNLCTNAAHAMAEDGGIMEVSLSTIETSKDEKIKDIELNQGQYVKITVSDTGHGIINEHLNRIFDPYFTTKQVGEGSGIGLSVVHGIVKSHNGAISVDSEYGKGTTFNVFLPVIEKEPAPDEAANTITPTGNERILFVDDEKSIANMATKMLERLGYLVTTKISSSDTLETFRTKSDNFDLVISDMSMPEITGDKLAKELQQIRPDIPIILCTGYSDRIDNQKAKSIGVKALIMKPIEKSILANTIRKVLD